MKYYNNYDLYLRNTMHLHCIARDVYIPENENELIRLISDLKSGFKKIHVLGAGSNVIMSSHIEDPVIIMSDVSKSLNINGDLIECGASVRVQHLIREAQKHEFGGIEYLFSVPCSVGGAVVMNAGRGNRKDSIGNYVDRVRCLNIDNGKIEILKKEDCNFTYRNSVFLNGNRIVLSVLLKLEKKRIEEIEQLISDRKKYALEKLDDRRPSSGSIFNRYNNKIINILKGLRIGGAEWSPKKNNWISNRGNAKNWQVKLLIYIACFLHKITFNSYHVEVEIW